MVELEYAILRLADTGESVALSITELSNIGIAFDIGTSGQYERLTISNVTNLTLDGSKLEIAFRKYLDRDPEKFYAYRVIEALFFIPSCTQTYEGMQHRLETAGIERIIRLKAIQGTEEEVESDYEKFIELAESVFLVNQEEKTYCGSMKITIYSEETFLTFDNETTTVSL